MERNIVFCCDGTANQKGKVNTNVVHLLRRIPTHGPNPREPHSAESPRRQHQQILAYEPGVGTFSPLGFGRENVIGTTLGKLFGHGLTANIENGYRFLMQQSGKEIGCTCSASRAARTPFARCRACCANAACCTPAARTASPRPRAFTPGAITRMQPPAFANSTPGPARCTSSAPGTPSAHSGISTATAPSLKPDSAPKSHPRPPRPGHRRTTPQVRGPAVG